MHAIILAGGKGTRLFPATEYTPKPLVEIHRKPILAYQLDALSKAGVDGITVVGGYLGDSITAFVDHYNREHGTSIEAVIIDDYENTNNMYGVWFVRDRLKDGCIISNGDVIYSEEVVSKLMQSEHGSAIAVAPYMYDEESMKVRLRENGTVFEISKQISEKDADATSIDLYLFSDADTETLLARCDTILNVEGRKKDWTEVAIQDILETADIYTVDLDESDEWIEIDTHEDYERAFSVITPPPSIHGREN